MPQTKFDPQKHHRRSIRLPNYDYSQSGAYYVTIVAWHRECLFGEVVNREMRLNKVGQIVQWEWWELPKRLRYIELGAFVVMPNHFHGILMFHDPVGATRQGVTDYISGKVSLPNVTTEGMDGSPLPRGPKSASLGAIMAQFKSRVTKRLWKTPSLKGIPIWQRNYYEHVVRNEKDLKNKTDYIEANPMLWDKDEENPLNIKS
jgi:REP element-mobilizing transposase RayT